MPRRPGQRAVKRWNAMPGTVDVLIIGAGPTGSTLAIDLVRRGLSVRIIEKNARSFPGSRAKGLQPRTLEVFDDLGLLNAILSAGSLYPSFGLHLGPFTLSRRMYKTRKPTSDIPFPNTWLIPQYATDAILHERLSAAGVRVEFNSRLAAFSQDIAGVSATLETPQGETTVACKFFVGADGGASTVRTKMGVSFPGKTDDTDRMIIVDCEVEGLSRSRWHAWPGRDGRFIAACPLPGGNLFQWVIRLRKGEEPQLDEASLNNRVRKHTKSGKLRLHNIQWTTVFRPNIRLAEHYRDRRVFLAGDAAHVHTPMGAQGLNTGVQDAYNLGWKLAQVLGGAPDTLLDSYEAERQPVAAVVLGMSTQKYEAAGKDPAAMKRGKDEQQLLISYREGPLGNVGERSSRTLSAGDRAPDATVRGADGAVMRLFELFRGPHFTAIAYGDDASADLARLAWPDRGAPLKRLALDAHPREGIDTLGRDASSFAKNYRIDKGAIILVRPDGYIAQIAKCDRVSVLEATVGRLCPH